MRKKRLDVLLAERGLAESEEKAKRLIMAGRVTVDGRVVFKPGSQVPVGGGVAVRGSLPYVSRGGLKLRGALRAFNVDVRGMVAADVGSSTGGFTDCLLQHGAARVYAIDVGYGQLAWKLRQDERVVVMERTNVRYLRDLPEVVDLATVDVSFISLTLVLPVVRRFLKGQGGGIIALIKPQFEARRKRVGKGGVVRDPKVHRDILQRIVHWCLGHGFSVRGLVPSPLMGPAGNVEFFVHLGLDGGGGDEGVDAMLDHGLDMVPSLVD